MKRKQFLLSLIAMLTAPLFSFKRKETLQELMDKGGLIKGKTFDITEQLRVNNHHSFTLDACRLNVKASAVVDGVWMKSTRTNPKGMVEIKNCVINVREAWNAINLPFRRGEVVKGLEAEGNYYNIRHSEREMSNFLKGL